MKPLAAGIVAYFVMTGVLTAQGPPSAATPSPAAPSAASLQTRPERTAFNETSTYADVVAFMEAAAKAAPKLIHLTTFGTSSEGRTLPLAVVGAAGASPDAVRRTGKLRVYIQGNIHAGEVEGKESAQMLLRELAEGKHADWLRSMVLLVAPIYNADGNEKFSLTNRGRQHGPMAGQGQRPNAQGYDLNRDHMKLDSPEARGVREADERVRSARVDGPAHDERDAARLPPHLRAAAQPGHRPRHRRSPAQGLAAVGDQDHQDQVRLGLLLLRQRRGTRPRRLAGRTRVEVVRFTPALQQQLHRPSQPHRDPQRGVLVRHLRGPHQGDEPVRRRAPRVRDTRTRRGSGRSRQRPTAGSCPEAGWRCGPRSSGHPSRSRF